MYCKNCGSKMNENAVVCVKCGVARGNGNSYCTNCEKATNLNAAVCLSCGYSLVNLQTQSSVEDDGNIGWGILGFSIPLIGLILYLVWKDSKPKSAKVAGKWALISFTIGFAFITLIQFGILFFSLALA